MTQEEKELLLKDLCMRLPYGVKLLYNSNSIANIKDRVEILRGITIGYTIWFETNYGHYEYESTSGSYEHFKPYLRPMSSMTEKELHELSRLINGRIELDCGIICSKSRGFAEGHEYLDVEDMFTIIDWLNKKMFDYRGLISMGLAIEAPKEMYNN